MRRSTIALFLLIVASVAWAAGQPSVKVTTVAVKKHRMTETLNAFGVVRPDPEAQTARVATYTAFVRRLDVTLGQPVKKGDPLLILRAAPSARAKYLNARASVRYARQAVARQRQLLKQHLATHANVNSAEQTLAQAQAAFAAQKARGTGQKTRVVTAPFAGIVSQLPINPGNQVTAGTLLFQLAKRDRLQAVLGIEPDEASRVKKGTPVQVIALFGAGNEVTGQVIQVNAVVDPNTRLVNVIAPLNGAKAQPFLSNMRVKGTLTLAAHTTLAVPRSAVLHDDQGDYVFVVRQSQSQSQDQAHRVNVATGIEHNGLIGVAGDLKAGQRIVVQGNYELSDGMAVRDGS